MTDLPVRRLLIDLNTRFDRRWCGGDAFRTAWFNALSMSFPVGEQFFIDAVRAGLATLPEAERELFAGEVQGFIGQEATHRRIHALFNGQLQMQGLRNLWHDGAQLRWRTWHSAASFLFGAQGLIRQTYRPWRAYFAPGFHPRQQEGPDSALWLGQNSAQFSVVEPAQA